MCTCIYSSKHSGMFMIFFFYWQTIWKGLLFTLNRYLWWFILNVHESSRFRIVENIDFLFTLTSVLDGEPQSRRWLTTPWQLEWPSPLTPHCFLVFWPVSWHFNRHVQSGFDCGEHLRTWARQAAGPNEDKQNKAFISFWFYMSSVSCIRSEELVSVKLSKKKLWLFEAMSEDFVRRHFANVLEWNKSAV